MKHPLLNQQVTLRGIPVIIRQESNDGGASCTKCTFDLCKRKYLTDCYDAERGTDVPPCYRFGGTYYEEVQA